MDRDNNQVVCPSCGKTSPKGKFCVECGAELPVETKFCVVCGMKLEENS
ncbi:zinc-ribbon domain-containing protein [Butyrivibrio fibrisolvens]